MENYSMGGMRSSPQSDISPIVDGSEQMEGQRTYRSLSKNPLLSTTIEETSRHTRPTDEGNFITISSNRAPRRRRQPFRDVFNEWALEIWCCILALGTIVAMWRTLVPIEGQLLPNWPQGITVNSVISLYVLVLKACLFVILSAGELRLPVG